MPKPKRTAAFRPPPSKPLPAAKPVCEAVVEPVEYLKLEHHHCRALLDRRGSDGLLLSCGRTKMRNESGAFVGSYCPIHTRKYETGRERKP